MNKHDLWNSLSDLYLEAPETLARGAVDEKGAQAHVHLTQNVDGLSVMHLQAALMAAGCDLDYDGAFGKGTQEALSGLVNQTDYVRARDFPEIAYIALKRGMSEVVPPATEVLAQAAPPTEQAAKMQIGAKVVVLAGAAALSFRGCDIYHFCQADPRWGGRILGNKRTFARAGCAVTSCAMLLTWLCQHRDQKGGVTPDVLDDYLDTNGGYQGDAIVWPKVADFARDIGLPPITYGRIQSGDLIAEARLRIENGTPPILRVRYMDPVKNGGASFNHFVLGVEVKGDGAIRFLDPGYSVGGDDIPDNVLGQSTRKGGYELVALDVFNAQGVA